jgi:hypothetical protein
MLLLVRSDDCMDGLDVQTSSNLMFAIELMSILKRLFGHGETGSEGQGEWVPQPFNENLSLCESRCVLCSRLAHRIRVCLHYSFVSLSEVTKDTWSFCLIGELFLV